MSATDAIMLIDCGSSGVKSSLIERASTPNGTPKIYPTTKQHLDAGSGASGEERIWAPAVLLEYFTAALYSECQRAKEHNLTIKGIALTSTTSSLVTVKDQRVMSSPPSLRWDDQRSREEAAEIEEIRRQTGSMPWMAPISADSGISKALWLFRNFPNNVMAPNSFTMEQWTFLNWFLTDRFVQSETVHSRKWGQTGSQPWPDAFKSRLNELLGLRVQQPNLSPRFVQELGNHVLPGEYKAAGDEIGPLSLRVTQKLGLSSQPRVFAAPYDTLAQVIGMGFVYPRDDIAITFGSSQGICAIHDPRKGLRAGSIQPFPDSPIRGMSLICDGISSCGTAITIVCTDNRFITNGEVDYDQISNALNTTEPGAKGVTMLPYYNGGRRVAYYHKLPRKSRKTRGGEKCEDAKIEGLNQGKDRANTIRALFESIAFITRGIVEDMECETLRRFGRVFVSGGPSANSDFIHILAAVLARDVVLFRQPDASLVGCAICAASGLGWYDSMKSASASIVQQHDTIRSTEKQIKTYDSLYHSYLAKFRNSIPLYHVNESNQPAARGRTTFRRRGKSSILLGKPRYGLQ